MMGWVCAMAVPVLGQVTNVGTAETNQIRVEWTAMPGNPYRVFASDDLVEPAWSNLTPDGVVFSDAQGFHDLPMGDRKGFCFAVASDYMIVDLSEGPDATNYPVGYTNAPPDGGWTDEYKTTKLVLRRIPAGTFTMGSPANELGRSDGESQHQVKLTKDYYIGVFEVTQKQWERNMGTWPSYFTNATFRDSRPVECVSYNDIRGPISGTNWPITDSVDVNSFMGCLRERTGNVVDLPTEAQWEYACRAGSRTSLNSGYDITNLISDAHLAEVGRYQNNCFPGYSADGSLSEGTAMVGSYLPNQWELFDMLGNVWEWCLDSYGVYPDTAVDPKGPDGAPSRILRGGSWFSYPTGCRSATRIDSTQDYQFICMGFRVALSTGR